MEFAACLHRFFFSHSTETNPRCSSPVDSASGATDKQAKRNHEKSGESCDVLRHTELPHNKPHVNNAACSSADAAASPGAWPVGEGKKAPLVASDSSSSGGSDSEEDDKKSAAAPTAAVSSETASAPKTADLKRFVCYSVCRSRSVLQDQSRVRHGRESVTQ